MKKKINHAVTFGKFYPFHAGHYSLIHSASVLAEKVTVVVLIDTERELLFNFEDRINFVKNGIGKYSTFGEINNISIVPVFHQLETNYNSDDTWMGFVNLVRDGIDKSSYKDEVTHYIGSDNSYGDRIAKLMSLTYIDLDDNRLLLPISATKIRQNALEQWDYINNDVKSFFTQRIVILGSESTGTTTLVNDLYRSLKSKNNIFNQSRKIFEYGRKYIEDKLKATNIKIDDLELTKEEIELFAEKQFLMEKNTVEIHGCPILLCDTDAFASQIWFKRYFGKYSVKIENIINELSPRRLYILTSMEGIPFEDDGTRDGDDDVRRKMEMDFKEELTSRNLPFIIVNGTQEQRVQQVLNYLNI